MAVVACRTYRSITASPGLVVRHAPDTTSCCTEACTHVQASLGPSEPTSNRSSHLVIRSVRDGAVLATPQRPQALRRAAGGHPVRRLLEVAAGAAEQALHVRRKQHLSG